MAWPFHPLLPGAAASSAGSGVQEVDVGRADETDTALALTRRKARASVIATEADTALARGRVKSRAAGLAIETDVAFALIPGAALTVGRADETDSAHSLARRKARAAQAAATTDSAFAAARRKSRAAGLAVETEQALSRTRLKIRACGTAIETDSALNLARRKIRGCGRADETDTAFARPPLGVIALPVGLAVEADTAFALEPAPPPAHEQPRGGDDRPAHPGWNRRRALLQRNRDREFTAQIRDLYRTLAADPDTAERAEAIVAAVVPPQPIKGESAAAREAALTARADALRRRADALEQDAVQAEIALRLLYAEFREAQERDDLAAVTALLPEFFAIDAEYIDVPRRALVADFWRDDLDLPALGQILGYVL